VELVLRYKSRLKRINLLEHAIDESKKDMTIEYVAFLEDFNVKSGEIVFGYVEAKDAFPSKSSHAIKSPLFSFMIRKFWEGFKPVQQDSMLKHLRELVNDVLGEQERLTSDTWDLISVSQDEPLSILESDWSDKGDRA